MAGYAVYSGGNPIGIKPVDYEIRLTSIEIFNNAAAAPYMYLQRYIGSTMSGGTSSTAVPLRDGAPAASSLVRLGASGADLTLSSTFQTLYAASIATGSASGSAGNYTISPATGQLGTPLPLTVAPGNVFYLKISANVSGGTTVISLYFEELRLQGSY